ncbi:uncharacterized protein LOC111342089 [Stylophora pistillata]|uniref:Uncharacterized protein n=1 Tax=Stylophora pistillata TaxID=50429 RepID=A0A2B4RJW2_STYPI|nr:uncharacterized protein LOC111342089 [Stylophora pistillata]PFX16522.1 hypothetical protein AWC38_SpisGene19203 [Stylophora pistillata]
MKGLVFILILSIVFQVKTQKNPDYIYKAAAQICKPYFLQCKQNPDRGISDCFQDVYKTCIPSFREGFQAIEKCVADAGDDLQSVMTCTKGFTEA